MMATQQKTAPAGNAKGGCKTGGIIALFIAGALLFTLPQAAAEGPSPHAQRNAPAAEAMPLSPRAQRGSLLARTYCARCHSIDKIGASPLAIAPAFRELHKRYPVESLEEGLGEGLVTGHPSMPEFRFAPDQIGDFIAFLKTLE
jgi:mono/diheme cytochrome c family protein